MVIKKCSNLFCVLQIVHRYDIILIQEVRDSDLSATKKLMEHVNKLDRLHKQSKHTQCQVCHLFYKFAKLMLLVFSEILLSSGTSSASLWVAATIKRDTSSCTGTSRGKTTRKTGQ